MKKIWLVIGIIVAVLLFVGITIYRATATETITVKTAKLANKEFKTTVMTTGTLSLVDEQSIYYEPERGEVSEIFVTQGDKVNKETVLLKYSNKDLDIEQKKQDIAVEAGYLKVNHIDKQQELLQEKEEELADELGEEEANKQVKQEYERLKYEKRMANLDLRQALLQQELYDSKNENAEVHSNIEGTVIEINKDVLTSRAINSQPLIYIANLNNYSIKALISEYDAIKVKEGQQVVITSDAMPNQEWSGKVESISPVPEKQTVVNDNGGTDVIQYPIKVSIDNPDRLKPGFQLIVEIETDKKTVPSLPIEAIINQSENSIIFIVENGKAVRREITTGLSRDNYIEIIDGVEKDDQVILNPPDHIRNGSEVVIQ